MKTAIFILMSFLSISAFAQEPTPSPTPSQAAEPSLEDAIAGVPENAGSDCKIRIAIVNFDWEDNKTIRRGYLTNDMLKWWEKDGKNQYPGVCLTRTSQNAQYILFWSDSVYRFTYNYTTPQTSTTTESGTGSATVYSGGRTATAHGSYNGQSQTTTYVNQQGQGAHWYLRGVLGSLDSNGKIARIYDKKHVGRFRWSNPDRDTLKDALKEIGKRESVGK
jgi:hypothetical protein